MHNFIKTPGALISRSCQKNKTHTKTATPDSLGDTGSNTFASKNPCEVIQSDNPGSEEALAGSGSESLQGLSQNSFIHDLLLKDSIVSLSCSSYSPVSCPHMTFSPINENGPYLFTGRKRSKFSHHIVTNINKYVLPAGQYSSSPLKDVDNERRLEDEGLGSVEQYDNLTPINASPGSYNASADLFDDGDDAEEIFGETLQLKHTKSIKRRDTMEVISSNTPPSWESPCTDVIVRRNSQFQARYLQDVHEAGTVHDLLSCLQSTPIIRPLSESNCLTSTGCIISHCRPPGISRRLSKSFTNFLLKTIKRSLSRRSSNVFCSIPDHFPLCSPVSTSVSEMSVRQVLHRRKTLVIKSVKKKKILEDTENCNGRRRDGRCSDDEADSSSVTECEMDNFEMDIGEDRESEQKSLPSDWSPELFNEKSNVYKQKDVIQRRLF
ncbi:uncharacterized protein [Pyxicephalus adspersus]|uniref:uncharacterized protein n=1 Tax=Pyxicephalus adspersus TaxID=30357 RepID=UPI003B5BBEBB